jgi:hypothetical protein
MGREAGWSWQGLGWGSGAVGLVLASGVLTWGGAGERRGVDDAAAAPFYAQGVETRGLKVEGSARVTPAALREAAYLIERMLVHRPEIAVALKRNGLRCAVMAYTERTTDLPEHRDLKPKEFWDVRARGLGATRHNPLVSCAEENLLAFPGDPYEGENILIHEFAHAIHGLALVDLDPEFEGRLRGAFDDARRRGLWKGTYAASNPGEYWAEGVQCWFDANLSPADFQHNDVHTREGLRAYDPGLASLVAEWFGDDAWRYVPPSRRDTAGRDHLGGYDPAKAPRFSWGEAQAKYEEVVAKKKADRSLETGGRRAR